MRQGQGCGYPLGFPNIAIGGISLCLIGNATTQSGAPIFQVSAMLDYRSVYGEWSGLTFNDGNPEIRNPLG